MLLFHFTSLKSVLLPLSLPQAAGAMLLYPGQDRLRAMGRDAPLYDMGLPVLHQQ